VMVFRDGEILFIKEKEDDLWSLPGGWADIGESPAEVTAREVREESGYRMRAVNSSPFTTGIGTAPAHPLPRLQAELLV
jgi:ADP-ribose pyrophosphatase YjhB (NUDIX family)